MISNSDDDEWMNIPSIVRQTLAKLEEDSLLSRKLTEALRMEHRQVNDLVRHLIDKQAGFEIDAARQQLLSCASGGESSKTLLPAVEELKTVIEKHRRKIKDIQAVVESDHKVQEKLNNLVGEFLSRKDADMVKTRDEIKDLQSQLAAVSACIDTRRDEAASEREGLGANLTQLASQIAGTQQQIGGLREYTKALTGRINDALDASSDVRSTVKAIQEAQQRGEEQNEQRFDAVLRVVDKSRAVSEGQVESVKTDLLKLRLHVTSDLEAQLKVVNATAAELRTNMRAVEEHCADSVLELTDQCEALAAQSKKESGTVQQLGTVSQRLQTQLSETETKVDSVSRRVEQLLTASDEHTTALRVDRGKVEQLHVSLNRMHADMGLVRDDVHTLKQNAITFAPAADVSMAVRELAQLKQEQMDMRTSLTRIGDTVQQLALTVAKLEKHPVEAASPQCCACQTSKASDEASTSLERTILGLLSKEREARECGFADMAQKMRALEQATQHMAHQIESVDRRCIELSSVCRWSASLQDEYGCTLKEVRPALVEMETVKRRVAALEADRTNYSHEQASRSAAARLVQSPHPELSKSIDELKRREVDVLRIVQGLEHRVDALAQHAITSPQKEANTPASIEDPHGIFSQLSADITRTLETALAAETTSATFRSTVETRLRECETSRASASQDVEELRAALTAVRTEIDTLRAEQTTLRQDTAPKHAVQALEQQCAQQTARLDTLKSELVTYGSACQKLRDNVLSAKESRREEEATQGDGAPIAVVDALDARLVSIETRVSALDKNDVRGLEEVASQLTAFTDTTEQRMEQLTKTVAETEVKGQRATGMLTRRLSDVNAQLRAVQDAQAQYMTRLDRAEAQLIDIAAASSPPGQSADHTEQKPQQSSESVTSPLVLEGVSQEVVDALEQRLETVLANLAARLSEVEEAQKAVPATISSDRESQATTDSEDPEVPPYYPRDELEERFENMWTSIVSLLARKEDQESVNKKLDGLHRLVGDELQVHLRRLQRDVENILAEKVSLSELQEILERSVQA